MNKILVAVYGSLKKGKKLHSLLEGTTFLGNDHVKGRMYKVTDWYPAMTLEGSDRIVCEIYEITEEHLLSLDRAEGYPEFYGRNLVNTKYGAAWIYNRPKEDIKHHSVVESGDWQ